jgi:hypothetical protein
VENPRTVSHSSHRPWKSRHSGGISTFPQLRRRSLFLREGEAKTLPKLQRPKVGQFKPPQMGQKKLPNSSISSWAAFGSLLVGLLVFLPIAWWQSYGGSGAFLPTWRRRILRLGLIGSTASLACCLADLARLQLIMREVKGYKGGGWLDAWGLTALLVLVITSTVCAAFGRGTARLLTILSGILLSILWFLLSLSTIP